MDPFLQAEANVGSDFAAYMVFNANVTVVQTDPDSGAAVATAAGVPALKRVRRRQEAALGGGELARDECRFVLQASAVGFVPKARDRIADADGLSWQVVSAEALAGGNLYAVNVEIER